MKELFLLPIIAKESPLGILKISNTNLTFDAPNNLFLVPDGETDWSTQQLASLC